MPENENAAVPSAVRVIRVEGVLKDEPAFKEKLGKKTETVEKRDGSKVHVSPEVIAVAVAIHAAGKDAATLGKADILKFAATVLGAPAPEAAAASASAPAASAAPPTGNIAAKATKANPQLCAYALLLGAYQMAEQDPALAPKLKKLNAAISEFEDGLDLGAAPAKAG